MNKEQALIEFFKGFRIVFNNAAAYSKEHPYYKKSADDFKLKLEALFSFLNPVRIGVGANFLLLADKEWNNLPLYIELAQMFHQRKIRAIEFQRGINTEEMVEFISAISLPIKRILRSGGIINILDTAQMPHCVIEELDYSALLRNEKQDSKDTWNYLLSVAVKKKDPEKLLELADNFGRMVADFRVNDFLEDELLRNDTYEFLKWLKDVNRAKFNSCTKVIFKRFLRDKNVAEGEKLGQAKMFFDGLSELECVETLCDEITANEQFSALNFSVFAKLVNPALHQGIASAFREVINKRESLRNNPATRKKIKELFLSSDNSFVPIFYQQALVDLFNAKDHAADEYLLDRNELSAEYRAILLDLFLENIKSKASVAETEYTGGLILEKVLKETDKAIKENNWVYLKQVWETSLRDINPDKSSALLLGKIKEHISIFVENSAFEDNLGVEVEAFLTDAEQSHLDFSIYIDRIFKEERINKYVLNMFLKFFPERMEYFYGLIEQKRLDLFFLDKLIQVAKDTNNRLIIEVLKVVFSLSNNVIKTEVLRAMQLLPYIDEEFLLSILSKSETFLKREALFILCKNELVAEKALDELFSIPSPFGKNNSLLIDNIRLIEGLNFSFARRYLLMLSKRHFFWNRRLRKTALEALKGLSTSDNTAADVATTN